VSSPSHPDGREELGAFRRVRPDGPRLGHSFTTIEDRAPISWSVVDEAFAHDEQGEPYLDLVAERDYGEAEGDLPDHELEHALAVRSDEVPDAARERIDEATSLGFAIELVALEPEEAPDWEEARRYIEALSLDTIEDDLLEMCGVDTRRDAEATWLETVKGRLRDDLDRFSGDVEGDHDEIEEWGFHRGRVFASVGAPDDEADPDSGYGWMCRLIDAGALGVAGFARVRKPELEV
jgi:hypothetical protein